MEIKKPYLLFLGDAHDDLAAKTAIGVYEWRPEWCVGQLRLPGCATDIGIDDLDVAAGAARGAKTLLLGVANRGGVISDLWQQTLIDALHAGMDIASGLHTRIQDLPEVAKAAKALGRQLHDVRHPTGSFDVASGRPRSGHRVLTVGTDCSVGKMYTSLALEKALRERDVACDFRATGQTGILIDGRGLSVDAVVADFISGSIEALCPAADPDHWDLVEGQGSLFHPSYAGVTLGLIHGAQPDYLVLCHEPTRQHMRGLPHQALPSIEACIDAYRDAAKVVSPKVEFAGIAMNTRAMNEADAHTQLQRTADEHGLPCVDPVRTGVGPIVDVLLS